MLISEFIDRLALRLRDTDKRLWTQEYLIQATDAAFAALCTVIPQAYTVHRDIDLVAGSEQTIDADLHRIVHIIGNVCPTTGQMKRAITKVDLSLMDRQHPQWRQDESRGYVWNYMLNALSEDKFYVWPPASGGGGVVADPGSLVPLDGPSGLTQYVPEVYTAENSGNVVKFTVASPFAFGTPHHAWIADFTGVNPASINNAYAGANTGIGLGWNTGAQYSINKNFNYSDTTESGSAPVDNNFLHSQDLQAAQDDGRNYIVMTNNGASAFSMLSGIHTLEDAQAVLLISTPSWASMYTVVSSAYTAVGGQLVKSGFRMQMNAAATAITAEIQALTQGTFFALYTSSNLCTENEVTQIILADGSEYNINWTSRGSINEFNAAGVKEFTDSPTQPTGLILQRHPVGDTPGEIAVMRILNLSGTAETLFDEPPSYYSLTAITQEDIDAYADFLANGPSVDMKLRGQFSKTPTLVSPTPVTPVTGELYVESEIPFDNSHTQALIEYALYYCLMRDDENTANSGRAMQHWQNFFQLLNKREASEVSVKTGEGESEV